MYLSIGGIGLKVNSRDPDFIEKTIREFKAFISAKEIEDCFSIEVILDYIPQEVAGISVFKKQSIFEIKADEFSGWLDVEHRTATVRVADLAGVFNCFLRVFYSVVLLEYNGFLVHSAGLAYKNKGYLFVGASESGKTTVAKTAGKDFKVLSDELVIIRRVNNEIFLFATPFKGEFEGQIVNQYFCLESILFLSKNIVNGFRQLNKMEMFTDLMVNIFFFTWDNQSNQKLIDQVNFVCDNLIGYKVDLFNYDIRRIINGGSDKHSAQQTSSLAAS